MVKTLPQPSATYLTYVNDRNVKALGPVLLPHSKWKPILRLTGARAVTAGCAVSCFTRHDTVIPAAESVCSQLPG